jgi:hypothetical protein
MLMGETGCVSYIIIFLFPNRRTDQMVGFLLILILLGGGLYFILGMSDIKEIKENWPKHRCKASVMPFASVYGFNTQENFTYCMGNILSLEAGPLLTPIFQILRTIIGSISIIINTINSFRVQIATMMGGINTIFQNFTDRISQVTAKVKMSAARIKSLMMRLYGIFIAIVFMSISGIRALTNFSNTFLFRFLDTFCFDPTTSVEIQGKGEIPIRDVKIGDIFSKNGARVTGRFEFGADGQPMVRLGSVLVSTNHFVEYEGKKIRADEHPSALPALPWVGGKAAPLICLNTDNHTIPIGNYIFMDYDESDDADFVSMKMIEEILNGGTTSVSNVQCYSNCMASDTKILTKEGSKKVSNIQVGETLKTGVVVGIVQKEVEEICQLPDGKRVGAGMLVWDKDSWKRAGDLYPISRGKPEIFTNVILTPSAVVETLGGTCFRDYMELHSHDAEIHYEATLRSSA